MPRQRFIAVDAVIYTSLKQIKTLSQFDRNRSECMYAPCVSKFSFFVRDSTYLKMCQFSDTCSYRSNDTHRITQEKYYSKLSCRLSRLNLSNDESRDGTPRPTPAPPTSAKRNISAIILISPSSHFLQDVPG